MKIKKNNIIKLPGANGNAYSSSKRVYESINVTKENTIESSSNLQEAIDWVVDEKDKGGVIVLSTDVNAIELSTNKFVNWIKKKVDTLKNRVLSTKKIDKVATKHNLIGWTIGHFLNGRYKAKNGTTFGENSLSIEVVGVSVDELLSIATDLCNEFRQETVLVKSYGDGNIYFVNGD